MKRDGLTSLAGDQQRPACRRCKRGGWQCKYSDEDATDRDVTPKAKRQRREFSSEQVWLPVPTKVEFYHEAFPNPGGNTDRVQPGMSAKVVTTEDNGAHEAVPVPSSADDPRDRTNTVVNPSQPRQGTELGQQRPTTTPFTIAHEVWLLRHYVEHVAPFASHPSRLHETALTLLAKFDFFDPVRHFAFDVPIRARNNAMLANALLALSARHIYRTRPDARTDEFEADRYIDACLRTLKPTLANDAAVKNDDLLATLCILRFLEEIDGKVRNCTTTVHATE